MKANAILLNSKDNVITVVGDVKKGSEAYYLVGKELSSIVAKENIASCHKIALTNIAKGNHVIKYGEIIGITTCNIVYGGLVHHLNIDSLPRDYESETK